MVVNIWRVEDNKQYFLTQQEATQEGEDIIVHAGIVHPADRTYKANKYQVNKNVTYIIKFDK